MSRAIVQLQSFRDQVCFQLAISLFDQRQKKINSNPFNHWELTCTVVFNTTGFGLREP